MRPPFLLLLAAIFVIVIVGLFIELIYTKKHAFTVIAPERFTVIKGKRINEPDDIVLYNTERCSQDEALSHIAKTKRANYRVQRVDAHLSSKLRQPFDESYSEIKNSFAESLPVSFVYKTATSLVDIARDVVSPPTNNSPYRMLISNNAKHVAFIDDGNVYLR